MSARSAGPPGLLLPLQRVGQASGPPRRGSGCAAAAGPARAIL